MNFPGLVNRYLHRHARILGAITGGVGTAIGFALLLILLIAFVPGIRESDAWSSIVSGLLGAALATIVQLFIGPEVQRRARRDDLRDRSRIDMLKALDADLRPALFQYEVELGVLKAALAQAHNPPAGKEEASQLLLEKVLKRFDKRRRETLLDANHLLWVAHLFAFDDTVRTLWERYEEEMTTLMFHDAGVGTVPSTNRLDASCKRVEEYRVAMYEHLFTEVTGVRAEQLSRSNAR
jgi:uncharacterized membrane protein YccC